MSVSPRTEDFSALQMSSIHPLRLKFKVREADYNASNAASLEFPKKFLWNFWGTKNAKHFLVCRRRILNRLKFQQK